MHFLTQTYVFLSEEKTNKQIYLSLSLSNELFLKIVNKPENRLILAFAIKCKILITKILAMKFPAFAIR